MGFIKGKMEEKKRAKHKKKNGKDGIVLKPITQ